MFDPDFANKEELVAFVKQLKDSVRTCECAEDLVMWLAETLDVNVKIDGPKPHLQHCNNETCSRGSRQASKRDPNDCSCECDICCSF